MRFYTEKLEASRNFANKIWNAARFVLSNISNSDEFNLTLDYDNLSIEESWILHKLNILVSEVTENLEKFEIGVAAAKLYNFFWDEFCDWYIEISKSSLGENAENVEKNSTKATLICVLKTALKLLHPFMPFITEEIWGKIPGNSGSIMVSEWPKFGERLVNEAAAKNVESVISSIKAVRNVRSEMNVPLGKKTRLIVITKRTDLFNLPFFARLVKASEVSILQEKPAGNFVSCVTSTAEILMPKGDLIDKKSELERLEKEKLRLQNEVERCEKKLENPGFVNKAPKKIRENERKQLAEYKVMLAKLLENLENVRNPE
jgi:valyl-tRNA synthetase